MHGWVVAVRGVDLEGTIGQVDVEVAPEVAPEVVLFLFRLQVRQEAPEPIGRQEVPLGRLDILVDDDVRLYQLGDFRFTDQPRRVVGRTVLRDRGPVVDLGEDSVSMAAG